MDCSDEIRRARDYLDERFGLDELWVYGSEARGTARPASDLDLGALFSRAPEPADVLDAAAELTVRLGRDVDVVDLDRVSPILAMQVLRHGRLVLDANPRRRHAHFARTVSRYEDLKIVRRPTEEALHRRFTGG